MPSETMIAPATRRIQASRVLLFAVRTRRYRLIGAALEVRAVQPGASHFRGLPAAPLAAARLADPEAPADQHVPADRRRSPPALRAWPSRGGLCAKRGQRRCGSAVVDTGTETTPGRV
jgi:hypothetical protein